MYFAMAFRAGDECFPVHGNHLLYPGWFFFLVLPSFLQVGQLADMVYFAVCYLPADFALVRTKSGNEFTSHFNILEVFEVVLAISDGFINDLLDLQGYGSPVIGSCSLSVLKVNTRGAGAVDRAWLGRTFAA